MLPQIYILDEGLSLIGIKKYVKFVGRKSEKFNKFL